MSRTTTSTTITTVQHRATPMGLERENGPHLADLRAFVQECDGLPDETLVRLEKGYMDEGGRYDITLSATYKHPAEADPVGEYLHELSR